MNNIEQYLKLAENLKIFYDSELSVLEGVLKDYKENIDGYVVIDERTEDKVLGFIIFGKIPLTVNGWDIYWLAVGKEYQGKGIGKRLITKAEKYILEIDEKANIRVETSTRMEYAHARNLYAKAGFLEAGRISDFYKVGDDIVIFYKRIPGKEN